MLLLLVACVSVVPPEPTPEPAPPVDTSIAGPRPASWVEPRVHEARERLSRSEGGQLLWKAIEAHGGLEPWLAAGTMTFDFDYAPVGAPEKRRYTRNQVDLWSRRAVQTELGDAADATFGWDGESAWIRPDPNAFPSDARFWSTTPFYFVALPWVLADPGANASLLEPLVVEQTGVDTPLPTVKITYEDSVGDAPDDFYVLHLHPETHRVIAVRYIVSYPGFFPDGGHSPEKLLLWSEPTEVDDLWMYGRYDSHAWNDGDPGPLVTEVRITGFSFGDPIPMRAFEAPD